jgi:hypothetical protein
MDHALTIAMEGHDNPPVPKDDSLHSSALAQCESAGAKEDVPLLMRRHPGFVSNPLAAVPFFLDILASSRAFWNEKDAAGRRVGRLRQFDPERDCGCS